jgi:hypothetical protein
MRAFIIFGPAAKVRVKLLPIFIPFVIIFWNENKIHGQGL